MGFTKLDDGLMYSSLMGEDDSVFKVFMLLLSAAKPDGVAPLSTVFLSTVTGKPFTEIDRCIHVLSSPDPKSRTPDNDGRRIERVDGGFLVLNYGKYRADTKTDWFREKKREQRAKPAAPEVEAAYAAYPGRCPIKGRATGKCAKDKDHIARLIDQGKPILAIMQTYVADCVKTGTPIKNLGTFLNNLPDAEQFSIPATGTDQGISERGKARDVRQLTDGTLEVCDGYTGVWLPCDRDGEEI